VRRPSARPLALAAILAAATAAGAPLRAQVVVGAPASGIQVAPGGQVTVPVVVDMTGSGGFSLGSLTAQLSWKPTTLRFVGATGGTFGSPTLNPDSATGTLRFAVANPAGASGQVVVLQATFDATGPSGDTTYLNVAVSELTAALSFTDLTPVTTSALLCVGTASGIWGDLDNSGTVTSFDALLIVTHAVGLSIAPNSPALGDVDADGQVTTRDALIVLTHVVSLPTPGFRPGQPVAGACGGPPPATVAAAPTTVALVVGDTVPLTAVARDSLGQVASAPAFAWTTLDTTVATVTPAGRLAAVGAGTTGAVVAVAPGVMDTVDVAVSAIRRTWYVDATVAAQQQTENGSPAYPFGTLQQAVDHAAVRDSVVVRGGVYTTGAFSTKPLTITGDPAFVAPWFRGPIEFSGIGADTVRLQRLLVQDAPGGIRASGTGGGVLLLDSVIVERAGAHGIDVTDFDSVALDRVRVAGAIDKGIVTTDVRALTLFASSVDGVSLAGGPGTGAALAAVRSQLVDADSVSFRLGNVTLDTVNVVRLHRVEVAESYAALFRLTAGASAILDTVSFRMGGAQGYTGSAVELWMLPGASVVSRATEIRQVSGNGLFVASAASAQWDHLLVEAGGAGTGPYGSVAAAFAGVGRVAISNGTLRGGALLHADTLGDARVLRLDTVDLDGSQLLVRALDTLAYRAGLVTGMGGSGGVIDADSVLVVALNGLEVTGQSTAVPAIRVAHADSLSADSLYVHDNQALGLLVQASRTATSVGSRFARNATVAYYYGNVQLVQVPTVRVAQGVFEESSSLITSLEWNPGAGVSPPTLVVDTTVFRGSGIAVRAYPGSPSTAVTLRGSRLERVGSVVGGQLLQGSVSPGIVTLVDNQVDTTQAAATYAVNVATDTLVATNNVLRGTSAGIQAYSPTSAVDLVATITGNTIDCLPSIYGSYGLALQYARGTVAGNTVRRCISGGIAVWSALGTGTLDVRGNTVEDIDSLAGDFGISASGYLRATISQNSVQRGFMPSGAIRLNGSIDTARVDSNVVQDGRGPGIVAMSGVGLTRMLGNLVERMRPYYGGSEAAVWINGAGHPDTLVLRGNRLQQNRVHGFHFSTYFPVRFDSNVVVDDSLDGVRISAAAVTGQFNFVARNGGDGLYADASAGGPITISQSVFQQNAVGARYVAGLVTLMNNYWGAASGPRCDTGCVGAAGDSLVGSGSLNYVPYLTAPPTTPIGAPPALRPGAVAAVVVPVRPRAVDAAWFERLRAARPAAAGGAR